MKHTLIVCLLIAAGLAGCTGAETAEEPVEGICAPPICDPVPAEPTVVSDPPCAFDDSKCASTGLSAMVSSVVTQNESVSLTIGTSTNATVQVTVEDNGTTAIATKDLDGEWTLDVPLPFGQSTIVVAADAGHSTDLVRIDMTRLAETTVHLQYNNVAPGYEDASYTVLFDVDALYSNSMYTANNTTHPGYANAHDLLVAFTQQTQNSVAFSYSASFDAFGVDRINGQGNPVTVSAPPWWCYTVNGDAAEGISLQAIMPGDEMLWDLGSCGFVPA